MGDKLVTIKEYAQMRDKSVQAVYAQIKGKENSKALEGHLHTERLGRKFAMFLDEEAVRILDESSKLTPNVVIQHDNQELIAELKAENESLKAQIANMLNEHNITIQKQNERLTELTDRILMLTDKHSEELSERDKRMLELTEKVLELTEKQNQEPENRSFWSRLFK